jgi:FkbM family methyltransferase
MEYGITKYDDNTKNLGYNDDQIYSNGEWNAIQHFIKKGDVVFDLGASRGNWSHLVFSVANPEMVYAFEPIIDCCGEMYKKFHFRKNIKIINNAAGSEDKEIDFHIYKNNYDLAEASNAFGRPEIEKNLNINVEIIKIHQIKLDDFCDGQKIDKIDFMKIDVEGSELFVLQGFERGLEKNIAKIVQFEFGGCWKDSKTKLKDAFKLLSKYNYCIFRIFKDGLIYIDNWYDELENYLHSNYLCLSLGKLEEMNLSDTFKPIIFEVE